MNNYCSEFGENPNFKKVDNAEPTATELAYLAGIFDGEGSLSFVRAKRKKKVTLGFHITNSSMDMLMKCKEILDKLISHEVKLYPKKIYNYSKVKSSLPVFTIDFRRQSDMLIVLEKLLPYLTAKRERALITITYLKHRLQERNGKLGCNKLGKESLEYLDKIFSFTGVSRGVTTERTAPIGMMPQSELISNNESVAEMSTPLYYRY